MTALLRAADRHVPAMTAAVFALIDQARKQSIAKAEGFAGVYRRTVVAGAEAEPSFTARLDVINPAAAEIARERAAVLLEDLSDAARETARQVFGQALLGQMSVGETDRRIRALIGLSPRDATAAATYRSGLQSVIDGTGTVDTPTLADRRFSLASLTPEKADVMADRYAQRLLARRAELIARTEVLRAVHEGQRVLWDDAASQGLFDPATARRVWVATEDGRICPECAELDGTEFSFDEFEQPPAHPQCRCTMSLLAE